MNLKYNYHTHTYRCHHCMGTDEEMVLAAIEAGMKELGFSDHMPWPLVKHETEMIRMNQSEIDDYVSSLSRLREKYRHQITIYIGFEAEYYPKREEWLRQVKEKYAIDYYILGQHFHEKEDWTRYYAHYADKKNLCKHYYEDCEKALRSGLFLYFAHPDIFLTDADFTDEQVETAYKLCCLCKELDIPMEYNMAGRYNHYRNPRQYPRDDFWRIAGEVGVKVIIGGDYHDPQRILYDPNYKSSYEFLASLGLEILDKLDVKKQNKD